MKTKTVSYVGNVVEFTPVGGLKGGGGKGRAEPHRDTVSPSAPKLLFQSKENLLLSVVHLGNDSDAGLSFLY